MTRWALLADVHGNLEALEAVLEHLTDWPGAALICAGDVVGYGADPEACVERLEARRALCVAGNHEGMVLGRLGFDRCVRAGVWAALWTRKVLSPAAVAWLRDLPLTRRAPPDLVVCHGSPSDPQFYVSTSRRAEAVLGELAREHPEGGRLICGHTHHQMLHVERRGAIAVAEGVPIELPRAGRCLINPGAVGQSRDGRPLARYARYDAERHTVTFLEVPYDHERASAKLRRAGLFPEVVLRPPRGARRHIERVRTRVARWMARRETERRFLSPWDSPGGASSAGPGAMV